MLELDALARMQPMIATPVYGFGATPNYTASLFRTQVECTKIGMEIRAQFVMGESLITRARNRLVSYFLSKPDATHLFFIDADIGWAPEQFARVLLADKDVCCGVYPIKKYKWPAEGLPEDMPQAEFEARYTPYPFDVVDNKLSSDPHGFGEVMHATTGFMCIKRDVLFRMMKGYPDLWYEPEDPDNGQLIGTHWMFFDEVLTPEHRLLSEDYGFCHRWRAIGGQVWIDLYSKLAHVGNHTWQGDLAHHLAVSPLRKG